MKRVMLPGQELEDKASLEARHLAHILFLQHYLTDLREDTDCSGMATPPHIGQSSLWRWNAHTGLAGAGAYHVNGVWEK